VTGTSEIDWDLFASTAFHEAGHAWGTTIRTGRSTSSRSMEKTSSVAGLWDLIPENR
jgi:hypothetical protein